MQDIYRKAYNDGKEILPDYVYDSMVGDKGIDDTIGLGASTETGTLVQHGHPMLSLPTFFIDFDTVELTDIMKYLPVKAEYTISDKLDGIAVSMPINGTVYQRMVSRGKRFAGFILHNDFMQCLPKPIHAFDTEVELRGELVISNADFETENAKLPENTKYANARSMVSAQANTLSPSQSIISKCRVILHGIQYPNRTEHHFDILSKHFNASDIANHATVPATELLDKAKAMYSKAMHSEIPCDGIVIEHSANDTHNNKVHTDRIALKQNDEAKYSGITKVSDIEWRLANDGSYFPWIKLEPVMINGSEVKATAGYCYDYLVRMNLSVQAEVQVTMRGGVIPYISKVNAEGTGNLKLPADIIEPEHGDTHIWSTNSEEAVQRMRFIRGMDMLNLDNCGIALFEKLYDDGQCHNLFDIASHVKGNTLHSLMTRIGLADTEHTKKLSDTISERFRTFNYVWLIMALRLPGIGFEGANIIGHILSGYTLVHKAARGGGRAAIQKVLADTELLDKVRAYSQPVLAEHANLSVQADKQRKAKIANSKGLVCMSKRPTNGMTKKQFAETYLQGYSITSDIKEAQLLIYPMGETSNKIKYAKANNIETKTYEDFN